ncbi:MAG TPA: sigma-70 family RNA polymerase sigma factor [Planctomycetota bacterium]|nr:sigma-70 family RNA polymerase sigma factor [Planctomycetota bacterium]
MDEEALGQHRAMLVRFLLFLLGNLADAEDLAQQTFRIALSKGVQPHKGTDYGAWLRAIARNLVRNHIRKQRRSRLVLHEGLLEAAEEHFVATGSDRDDAWAARRQALLACLEKLSQDERELVRRRYERQEQVKQMAEKLAVEPNTLSKRLERIRGALRDCINATLNGQSDE